MFRVTRRLPRPALLSGAVAAAIAISLPESEQKLTIYPSTTTEVLLVDSPSDLEKQIGNVRRRAQGLYCNAYAQVQGLVSKWIGIEHAVERRVKTIVTPDEPLTPGILYVGIATLSGSIIARNRRLPTRFLLPPIFLIASAQHFLPRTSHNLSAYLGSLEDKYLPRIGEKHDITKAHATMTWERVKDAGTEGRKETEKLASRTVDKVQEWTGLKVRESLGWEKESSKSDKSEPDKSSEQ